MWPMLVMSALQAAKGQQDQNNANKPNGGVDFGDESQRNNFVSKDPGYSPYQGDKGSGSTPLKQGGGGGGWGSLVSSVMSAAKGNQAQNQNKQLGQGANLGESTWWRK